MLNQPIKPYVAKKIYPTNFVLIALVSCLAIPFSIISYFYFDWLTIFPFAGGVACVISYFLIRNTTSGIHIARVVVCLVPEALAAAYNAYLSDAGGEALTALSMCQTSFVFIPFVIYDFRKEIIPIIINTTICSIILMTFEIQNELMISDINSLPLRSGWLMHLTRFLALASAIGSISGLAIMYTRGEDETRQKQIELDEATAKEEEVAQNQKLELERMKRDHEKSVWVKTIVETLINKMKGGFSKFLSELCSHLKTCGAVIYEKQGDILYKKAGYASESEDAVNIYQIPLYRDVLSNHKQYVVPVPVNFINGVSNKYTYITVTPVCNFDGELIGIIEVSTINNPTQQELELLQKASSLATDLLQKTKHIS